MRRVVAGACLLTSGFAGLVYEICWIREASLVFGSTTQALSTVVAVFFGGLALGSWLAGRARPERPMRVYAALELGLAAVAACSPMLFGLADRLFGVVYRHAGSMELALARVGLLTMILLVPSTLMGATLPLFCRQLVVDTRRAGASIAALYAVNTLGAALGCLATGWWLLPRLGVTGCVRLAAAGNLLVALIAWSTRWPDALEDSAEEAHGGGASSERPRASAIGPRLAGVLFFLVGFAIAGDEVLWSRYLGLLIEHDVYTYTITLGTILVGIVVGSALAARLSDRLKHLLTGFALLQIAMGLYVLWLTSAPPALWRRVGEGLGVYFLLMLPPAVLSGATFPLAVRMVVHRAADASAGVGRMAALNTLGGIAGSLVAGFVAMPWLGLQASLHLFTAVSVVTGMAAWLVPASDRKLARRALVTGVVAIVWAVSPALAGTRVPEDFLAPEGKLVDVREGRAANVAVVAVERGLELTIDRMWQGQSEKNHQIVAAHLPMMLHPAPQDVLVVGVGAGLAPSRFLLHPALERLDCVDIEPAVFELIAEHFDAGWMSDPRVRLLSEDGRNHVRHTAMTYDVVSIEVGQTMRPGIGSFYTVDFYRRARERLNEGGVLSQFLPLQYFPPELLRRALASFAEVFPVATLWYNKTELLLVGFARPDVPRLQTERLIDDRLFVDLAISQWGGEDAYLRRPEALTAGLLLGPEGIAAVASGRRPFVDDRPELDYAVSALSPRQVDEREAVALIEPHLAPALLVGAHLEGEAAERFARVRAGNLADLAVAPLLRRVDLEGAPPAANRALLVEALRLEPRHREAHNLLGELSLRVGDLATAELHFRWALRIEPADLQAARGLAFALHRAGKPEPAIELYRSVLRRWPEDATTHNNLGVALAAGGDLEAATRHFERAVVLRPDYADAVRNLDMARRARGGRP